MIWVIFRTAVLWWLRSPYASNSTNFVNVNTDGTVNNNNANYSNGFAPRILYGHRADRLADRQKQSLYKRGI